MFRSILIKENFLPSWEQVAQENLHSWISSAVWIKKAKDIFPIKVIKDLNDGSFTAVTGNIQDGDEVVTGINQNAPADTKTSSPFMPKFPSRKK